MAKTQEELNVIKEEVEALNKKLAELTEGELAQVTGGATGGLKPFSEEKGFGFIESQPYERGSDKNAKVILK